MNSELFLGIVKNGKFKSLEPKTSSDELTTIAMQVAMTPESNRINLEKYEGMAVMISGHDGGGYIYSAKIIDQASPILTAVVKKNFGTN